MLIGYIKKIIPVSGINFKIFVDDKPKSEICPLELKDVECNMLLNKIDSSKYIEGSNFPHPELLQVISNGNNIFGRAFIDPTVGNSDNNSGLITVGGLRSTSLKNVSGILYGKPLSVDREHSIPIANNEILKCWATHQASLISNINYDGLHQAKSAEVILNLEGEIGNLKIVKLGNVWLNESEFMEKIIVEDRIFMHIRGEIQYDKYIDNISYIQFKNLKFNDNVAQFPNHNGNIIDIERLRWPNKSNTYPNDSRLYRYLQKILNDNGYKLGSPEDDIEIGHVDGVQILRRMSIYRKV